MNDMQKEGVQERLPQFCAPIFPKCDSIDRLFAVIYLLVGYAFIYACSSYTFEQNLALFTVSYGAVVLAYLWGKEIRPSKESWFWLGVMLSIGVPYAFWSTVHLLQVPVLMAVAAYWTLSASGRLMKDGRTSQWVIFDGWNALVEVPFCNFICQVQVLFQKKDQETDGKKPVGGAGGILLGLLIALPALAVILPLLSSADAGFQYLIENMGVSLGDHLLVVLLRMFFAVPVSFYLFGLIFGGVHGKDTDRIQEEKLIKAAASVRRVPDTAICTALTVICLVYCLFIGLQGAYLFSAFGGRIPEDLTYSEYARRGFFELCRIGAWNLIIAGCAGGCSRSGRREHKGVGVLLVLLSVLTLLLLATAVSKMGMYISVYGLTVNRILPLVFMLWMGIAFFCMILRQWKDFPAVRCCILAGAVMFCLLCLFPIEDWTELYNTWARARGLIV